LLSDGWDSASCWSASPGRGICGAAGLPESMIYASATPKAFTIILFTIIFCGFHSPRVDVCSMGFEPPRFLPHGNFVLPVHPTFRGFCHDLNIDSSVISTGVASSWPPCANMKRRWLTAIQPSQPSALTRWRAADRAKPQWQSRLGRRHLATTTCRPFCTWPNRTPLSRIWPAAARCPSRASSVSQRPTWAGVGGPRPEALDRVPPRLLCLDRIPWAPAESSLRGWSPPDCQAPAERLGWRPCERLLQPGSWSDYIAAAWECPPRRSVAASGPPSGA